MAISVAAGGPAVQAPARSPTSTESGSMVTFWPRTEAR